MAKYKTIVDNLNVYYNDEVIEVLKIGTTIEVEKIIPEVDHYGREFELAILKDGNEIIASFEGKSSIEIIKKGVKK